MRAREFLNETRDRMFQYIKSVLPKWPDYVLRDWIYNLARGTHQAGPGDDPEDPTWKFNKETILKMIAREGMSPDTQWKLVPNFEFKMEMLHPDTQRRIRERDGGRVNPYQVPNDAARHATQAQLAQKEGGVRKEPVIGKMTPQGFELIEGWHRTIQHFDKYPNGYRGPAWVAGK